jgi:4-hydroxy-tetrahydrodipicolinate reductase
VTRAVVVGAAGRMGRAILSVIREGIHGVVVGGGVEPAGSPFLGLDVYVAAGVGGHAGVSVTDDFAAALSGADVAIDFTSPDASVAHAKAAAEAGKAIVIGTTGLTDAQKGKLAEAAKVVPVVFASNMSVGVNLMFRVAADVAKVLGDEYDVEIVEVHHRFKKDAPSGTAKTLAETVAAALGRNLAEEGVYGREGITGERSRREIGVHAVRAGDVVGEHTLVFGGIGERFEITHRAHSRDTFARGAVRAAAWAAGRAPGLYDMRAVLGI